MKRTRYPTVESSTQNRSNRRGFLKTVGLAALAAPLAPEILAGDKACAKGLTVGCGEHQFEVLHDWGQLPDGYAWGNTHSVCEDSQGRIYVKHTVGAGSRCDDAIVVFDADGKFVAPHGACFDHMRNLFVVEWVEVGRVTKLRRLA
jgi:hypothetical protein